MCTPSNAPMITGGKATGYVALDRNSKPLCLPEASSGNWIRRFTNEVPFFELSGSKHAFITAVIQLNADPSEMSRESPAW